MANDPSSSATPVSPAVPAALPAGLVRRIGLVLGLSLLSVLLIGTLLNGFFRGENIRRLFASPIGPVHWTMLIAALAVHLAGLGFEAVLLKILSAAIGKPARFIAMLRVYLAGNIGAQITPSAVGGEPAQLFLLARDGYPLAESSFLLSVRGFLSVAARVLLLAAFALIAVPAAIGPASKAWNIAAAVTAALLILFYAALFLFFYTSRIRTGVARVAAKYPILYRPFRCRNAREFEEKCGGFALRFRSLMIFVVREQKAALAAGLLASLLSWVAVKSAPFFVMRAFGQDPSWLLVIAAGIMSQVASGWAPTPGAVGAAEAAMAAFFLPLVTRGDPAVLIPVFILIFRFFDLPLNIVVGGALLPGFFRSPKARAPIPGGKIAIPRETRFVRPPENG